MKWKGLVEYTFETEDDPTGYDDPDGLGDEVRLAQAEQVLDDLAAQAKEMNPTVSVAIPLHGTVEAVEA